jgi:hypothetical protein
MVREVFVKELLLKEKMVREVLLKELLLREKKV